MYSDGRSQAVANRPEAGVHEAQFVVHRRLRNYERFKPVDRIRRVHAFIAAPVVAREPQPAVLSPPEFEKRWQTIARETGFRDRRHLREAFVRGFGVPPQAVRRDVRSMPA